MKKVILREYPEETIYLDQLKALKPVFAKKEGKLVGMLGKENAGWVLRLGRDFGGYGYWEDIQRCIIEGMKRGYDFYIEDD